MHLQSAANVLYFNTFWIMSEEKKLDEELMMTPIIPVYLLPCFLFSKVENNI